MDWTYTQEILGYGGMGDLHCYPFRENAVDGIYVQCTSVRPMTNYIVVTFRYGTTTKGSYTITEGQSTPTITDIGDQDVITEICGVDDDPENNYDVTVRIHVGRD